MADLAHLGPEPFTVDVSQLLKQLSRSPEGGASGCLWRALTQGLKLVGGDTAEGNIEAVNVNSMLA